MTKHRDETDWAPGEKRNRERLKELVIVLLIGLCIGLWFAQRAAFGYAEQQMETSRQAIELTRRCIEAQEPLADSLRAFLFRLGDLETQR